MDMSEEPVCMEIYRRKCTWICQKSHFVWKLTRKKAQAQVTGAILWLPGTTFGMEVEAHVTRAILYGNLQEKCRAPNFGPPILCGNLQEKMHMDMSQEPFCVEIYRKNAAPRISRRTLCVEIYRKKTRVDIAQEPFCMEISTKKAGNPRPHLDLHVPLFILTVRTPSVWPHWSGEKHVYCITFLTIKSY